MKPKEYIKKYDLTNVEKFNHEYFVADLAIDFKSNLEVFKEMNQLNYNRFQQCVKEIKDKFDIIFLRSILKDNPIKLWDYFYATVVGPVKDEMFGEYIKKKKEDKKKYSWTYKDPFYFFNNCCENIFGGSVNSFMSDLIEQAIGKDTQCFSYFDLTPFATKEEVMDKFRSLAMVHHPDKGGDVKIFREMVEAKNRCLLYLN